MIFKRTIFSCLLFIATNMVVLATQDSKTTIIEKTIETQDEFINYIVKSGDTAYSIANSSGITLKDLYKYNPEAEKGVKAGQTLRLPLIIVSNITHKIASKETLYSVSRMYSVPTKAILTANDGLSEKNFKVGKTIKIPVYNIPASIIAVSTITGAPTVAATEKKTAKKDTYIMHTVAKGETLYSISKEYGVLINDILSINNLTDGLKQGETIKIPRNKSTANLPPASTNIENTPKTTAPTIKDESGTRIAILLPFAEGSQSVDKNKIAEMYNGFLLAVKNLKEQGKNAEIYSFDIGDDINTQKLEGLLETIEMKSMNLIVGGISKKQIDLLSQYSKKTGIKYVIPLDSKSTTAYTIPSVYRMTTSPSSLYSEAIDAFIRKYKGQNIIFVSSAVSDNNKKDFTTALQQGLTKAGISYSSANYTDLKTTAKSIGKNVLVPTSSTESLLKQILATVDNDTNKTYTLFGYPEWQIYTNVYSQLQKYDATIYTIFFLNENQPKVVAINNEYKEWFGKPMMNSFPKWGYLGYDMGLFFVSALNNLNTNFSAQISTFNVPTLQSDIHFEHEKETGGYINMGLYFVQFKNDGTIEKTECK